MIYLDNAATTKMFDECVQTFRTYSCDKFFNPSALSIASMEVTKNILGTSKFLLEKLGANVGDIIYTGCATESNNLAIKGSVRNGVWEYVFSSGEHPSVYNVAKKLEQDGCVVHFVPLKNDGTCDLDELKKVLNEKTRLISIMHVSNETGALNDLVEISKLKQKFCPKAILHVDGVQAFMKIPFKLSQTSVDLYSFSAHKIHGPKGVAGLYVKNKGALKELFQGGGQQFNLRSGTENVAGIMQLKTAVELIDVEKNYEKVMHLKNLFKDALNVDGIVINDFGGSPYILNLMFLGVKGETMLHALEEKGVIVGLGSACSAKKAGNRILQELGFSKDEIISSVRISFNAYMTESEILDAAKIICEVYADIKRRVQ